MHYLVNIFHPTSFHHKFCLFFEPLKSRKFLARLSVWAQTVGPSLVPRPSLRETTSGLPNYCCCCNTKCSWSSSGIKTVFIEPSILFESPVLPDKTWRIFKCDLTLSIIEIDLAPQSYLFSGRSTPAAGGVLFSDKRMGLCCFMRSHYHDWIGYRTGKLSTELLEWSRTLFEILG